jgi:hypothetical protein
MTTNISSSCLPATSLQSLLQLLEWHLRGREHGLLLLLLLPKQLR